MGPLITEEELMLVKSAIMLPMILAAFDRDKKKIESVLKTPDPYTELLDQAIKKVITVHTEVKRTMFKSGLKMLESERDEDGITTKYLCRGYHGEMTLLNDFLRAQCSVRMMAYLGLDTSQFVDPTLPGDKPITQ